LTEQPILKHGVARSWISDIAVYRHPRVAAMLFLGFSAGLPFSLVAGTLTAWLATTNASIADIGMFAWVGLLYALKFLWAPLVDRLPLPIFDRLLGRRRSWMLLSQVGVLVPLYLIAFCDPTDGLANIALLSVAIAFASATQDIVIDAYRIEAADESVQGAMAASYQLGYRIALLVAVAGALYVAEFASWSMAYKLMAGLMMVGVLTTLMIDEPDKREPLKQVGNVLEWLSDAVVGPFREFFVRNGMWALVLFLFIGFYRFSDLVLGVMANPFYIDIGFSLSEIATVTKVFGFFVTIFGAALGGISVVRFGVNRPLVWGAFMLAITNLFFAGLAILGEPKVHYLMVTISADNFAAGYTGTVFIAYLSRLTSTSYTATQYALLSSMMNFVGKLVSGFSGQIVEATDWVFFFVYASCMGIPAIFLAIWVTQRNPEEKADVS
jgi:MFS transporter, PAT family, beta-lactamase induction signal transducer AmpG